MTGDLSAKAYGILMAIIQHNLSISVDNLRTHFKEGERAISSGLKELREINTLKPRSTELVIGSLQCRLLRRSQSVFFLV